MTFFTLFALVLLPILGGFIAWAGDVIGYRLGKSRRSLFGMRPRVTARVVGVVVGVISVVLTLAVAAIGSSNFRDALFNLQQLRSTQITLLQQNAQLKAQNVSLQHQVGSARQEAQQATSQAQAAHEQVTRTRGELSRVQAQLAPVRLQLTEARQQLTGVRRSNQQLSATNRQLRDDTQVATRQRDTARTELAKTKDDLQVAAVHNRELQTQRSELEKTNLQLASNRDNLQRQVDDLTRQTDALKASVVEYQAQATEAQKQANEFFHALGVWQRASDVAPVAYQPGEEIISQLLETDQTQGQLEASLGELVRLASVDLVHHGAAVGEEGLALMLIGGISPDHTGPAPTAKEIIQDTARRIRLSSARTYLVAVRPIRRVFEDEDKLFAQTPTQVPVELSLTPNDRLYRPDDLINTVQLDGSHTRGEVFRDLLAFIQDTRRVLGRRGVLPDPQSGQVLTMPAEDILATLDALVAAKRPETVQIVAGADVYKAMPESDGAPVRLRVVKSEAPSGDST